MKIELLEGIGGYGFILDADKAEADGIDVEVGYISSEEGPGCGGVLSVGARNFRITDGKGHIREYELAQGSCSVVFRRSDGTLFNCGSVVRSGRYISVVNDVNSVAVALAEVYCRQNRELELIKSELASLKERFGISVI